LIQKSGQTTARGSRNTGVLKQGQSLFLEQFKTASSIVAQQQSTVTSTTHKSQPKINLQTKPACHRHSIIDSKPVAPLSTIVASESWKKVGEKEKQTTKRFSVAKTPALKEGADMCEDEQAIIDAAWVKSRDKVFKKKRNSLIAQKTKEVIEAALPQLEDIDEKEESQRICIEDLEVTPLKKKIDHPDQMDPMSTSGYFTHGLRSSRDTQHFRSFLDASHLLMSQSRGVQEQDDSSSNMYSQAGSPSRKMRRTREERRKTTDGLKSRQSCVQDENMINVSPMKKPKLSPSKQVLSEVDVNTMK